MEYITSRGFEPAESAEKLASELWYNLWRIKLWPYQELVVGDLLYWYETHGKSIGWKSHISDLDRFPYDSKAAARDRLKSRFRHLNTKPPGPYEVLYFQKAPERGYCLAFTVKPLERLNLPKPDELRFPRKGWLRVDAQIAQKWLGQSSVVDNVTLDMIASTGNMIEKGNVIERLHQLNEAMVGVRPERVRSMVSLTLRGDTGLVGALKEACEFCCQFPGCGIRIPKRDGGFYIEVAHVQPVHEGGQSVLGNLLVLCPNHHKELEYGDLEIVEQTVECVSGKLNGKKFEIRLPGSRITA